MCLLCLTVCCSFVCVYGVFFCFCLCLRVLCLSWSFYDLNLFSTCVFVCLGVRIMLLRSLCVFVAAVCDCCLLFV